MERKRLWQFIVSAVSLVISLGLDLYFPQVKDVLCTALPVRDYGNSSGYGSSDLGVNSQLHLERIK
jgi:hypothetical protein